MAGPPMPPPSANRTDRNVPGPKGTPPGLGQPNGQPLPVQVPTGLPYGEAQQLQQAQQAVHGGPPPMPAPPAAPQGPQPAGSAPPGPAGPQGAPLDMAKALTAARGFQMPNMGGLTRPTERPNEPVTAGLPGSPTGTAPVQTGSLSAMLSSLAQASSSAAISQLAARAQAAGQ